MTAIEDYKKRAALAALDDLAPGMRLGLGTGSTARHFIEALGARVRAGLTVRCVPTSEATARLARDQGIVLTDLNTTPELDLTVDGADEIGPGLALIKGGGGALLREKIVAAASARMLVIADASKLVDALGRFPLPVEVVPFASTATRIAIERAAARLGLAGDIALRQRDGTIFVTDEGNHILDASFGRIPDPEALDASLSDIPGVVEHGLFIGLASAAVLCGPDGLSRIAA